MDYDEFSMLADNAAEVGVPFTDPVVARHFVEVAPGQRVSALRWGTGDPELVLIHGGAQNAHTWDTLALLLDRPLLAVDLPGHGHSDWRADGAYQPPSHAEAVVEVIRALAPAPRAVIVDVTPGVGGRKASPVAAFVDGPEVFASFEEILERTVRFNPTRSEASLRRGVLHNARPREDGTWVWRYDRSRIRDLEELRRRYLELWDDVSAITCPLLLVRGGASTVVPDDDADEWRRRQPTSEIVVVEGAGHSVQGDEPAELAALVERFVFDHA